MSYPGGVFIIRKVIQDLQDGDQTKYYPLDKEMAIYSDILPRQPSGHAQLGQWKHIIWKTVTQVGGYPRGNIKNKRRMTVVLVLVMVLE